jgi:hypothetical protein
LLRIILSVQYQGYPRGRVLVNVAMASFRHTSLSCDLLSNPSTIPPHHLFSRLSLSSLSLFPSEELPPENHKYHSPLPRLIQLLFSISTHKLHFTLPHYNIQTTPAFQANPPNNQHAFHPDFHPQGPDQPRRLLRCHVNDLRSLPNGARVS